MPIRIAIVSCRPLVRGLISEWLRAKAETEIVVEATTMEPDVIAKCSEANLLILDASDCFAFSAVASVRSLVPSIRVLIISSGQGDYVLHRASLVGATGVIHEADTLDVFFRRRERGYRRRRIPQRGGNAATRNNTADEGAHHP